MARAIQPFHTLYDGDVLFAVTTGEVENPGLNEVALGVIASELAWDAGKVVAGLRGEGHAAADVDALIASLRGLVQEGDHVVFMSNGGFDGAPRRFLAAIQG